VVEPSPHYSKLQGSNLATAITGRKKGQWKGSAILNHLFQFSDMEAECSDDVMKLRVKFNATFSGLIYSAGKANIFLVY
jgi:hypothetical protein